MKNLKILSLVLLISTISIFKLLAQGGMEDVVYLKSGSIYRGMIIEQVPNVSLKIQTAGGNVFAVNITDIIKITKEQRVGGDMYYGHEGNFGWHGHMGDSAHQNHFHIRKKGYFFQSQLLIENLQGGVRIINGYRFNRYAALGVGVGVDYVFSSPVPGLINNLDKSLYAGAYMPLYLYLTGDILKKRITPFYAVEAGVAMYRGTADNFNSHMDFGRNMQGGPMGGLGIGVKFYTHSMVNFSLLANINFKDVHLNEVNTYYDQFGNPYTTTQKVETLLMFPGIRFGVGF